MPVRVNGAYAPPKQFFTDTDFEEERKMGKSHLKAALMNHLDVNSGVQSKNYTYSDYGDYTSNPKRKTIENIGYGISNETLKKCRRWLAFGMAVIIFFSVLGIFFSVIPCAGRCHGSNKWPATLIWDQNYNYIEFTGDMQVVNGATCNQKNLIFIFRGNQMEKETEETNSNENGIIQIVGASGKIGWYINEQKIPQYIKCNSSVIANNASNDCIVSGTDGFTAALNPIQGGYYWYAGKQQGDILSQITKKSNPINIQDLDGDGIQDFLVATNLRTPERQDTVLIISGKTGNIIGNPWIPFKDCLILTFTKVVGSNIKYYCDKGRSEEDHGMVTFEMIKQRMMMTLDVTKPPKTYKERVTSQKKHIRYSKVVYTNGPGQLVTINSGTCPIDCSVKVTMTLEKMGKKIKKVTYWEYSSDAAIALRAIGFAHADDNRVFILKLRQWNKEIGVRYGQKMNEFIYNDPLKLSDTYYLQFKETINISRLASTMRYKDFFIRTLSERIILINFNDYRFETTNLSLVDVTQICARDDEGVTKCQPSFEDQGKTLAIADLDGDNRQELVSYFSTFIPINNGREASRLVTLVDAFRLKKELPKYFNSPKSNYADVAY